MAPSAPPSAHLRYEGSEPACGSGRDACYTFYPVPNGFPAGAVLVSWGPFLFVPGQPAAFQVSGGSSRPRVNLRFFKGELSQIGISGSRAIAFALTNAFALAKSE